MIFSVAAFYTAEAFSITVFSVVVFPAASVFLLNLPYEQLPCGFLSSPPPTGPEKPAQGGKGREEEGGD